MTQLYVVQTDPYGKFAVTAIDDFGAIIQTVSLHDTREEAVARAQYLQGTTTELEALKEPEPERTPPALRGYP